MCLALCVLECGSIEYNISKCNEQAAAPPGGWYIKHPILHSSPMLIETASPAASVRALGSIAACLRTQLGPQTTLKFAEATPRDGALLTGDALTILDRLDVSHPAGTLLVEACEGMASSQGCGITTLVCLTGEFAKAAMSLQQQASLEPAKATPEPHAEPHARVLPCSPTAGRCSGLRGARGDARAAVGR